MNKKLFRPLFINTLLCGICYAIFRLTLMGPEAGILFQRFPILDRPIVIFAVVIVQVFVILLYFHIGKKICSFSMLSLFSIAGVSIMNIVYILIIYCFNNDIKSAIKEFTVFLNAPFFLMSVLSEFNVISNIILVFMPSIIIFIGNVYGYVKVVMLRKTEK